MGGTGFGSKDQTYFVGNQQRIFNFAFSVFILNPRGKRQIANHKCETETGIPCHSDSNSESHSDSDGQ